MLYFVYCDLLENIMYAWRLRKRPSAITSYLSAIFAGVVVDLKVSVGASGGKGEVSLAKDTLVRTGVMVCCVSLCQYSS